METPWLTDKWFTSPWNWAEEALVGVQFAPKIKLHDVTLRDGEQQAGLVFNKDEKIRIAEKLAEIGIHRIEAGMPAVSRQDQEAITEIARRNLGPEIFAFGRCMVDDVKRAVDCGVTGIVIEIPSSEHIIQYAYGWTLAKAMDLSIKATLAAKEAGLYTVFFPIDSSRAEINWCLDLLTKVAEEGHMDALAVVDTFGGLGPHSVPYLINKIKSKIRKPLEAHFHDDFGLGAANTIIALAAGAEVAHTTVTAIGERAGNAPYENVVLALLTMYGVDLGLDYSKIYETSRLVRETAGLAVQQNRGIVGDQIFEIESGIIAGWFRNCGKDHPLELAPFRWDLVGHKAPEIVLGKNSGLDSIALHLEKHGLKATEDQMQQMVAAVKAKAFERHGLLDDGDFLQITEAILEKEEVKV